MRPANAVADTTAAQSLDRMVIRTAQLTVEVQEMERALAEREALQRKLDSETLASFKLTPVSSKKAEVLTKHVRESFEKDTQGLANVLRSWLHEDKPKQVRS